jgi:hypothetical protein
MCVINHTLYNQHAQIGNFLEREVNDSIFTVALTSNFSNAKEPKPQRARMLQILVVLLFICATLAAPLPANIFEIDVVDSKGNTVSLSTYQDAKAILIGKLPGSRPICPQ